MPDPVAAHWVHDLDPFLWQISGDFGLRWYGLSYLAGVAIGWWLLIRWAKAGRLPIAAAEVGDAAVALAIGMVAGGRLGYALGYDPALFTEFTTSFPWWRLLALNEGGMASHGGMLGMAAAAWWWCRKRGVPLLVLSDAVAAVGPIGIACGRLANFINGELWGRPWNGSWAVIFPQAEGAPPKVDLQAWIAANHAWLADHGTPRHPSQLYAMGLEGLLVAAVLIPLHALHRRPGLTLGLFMTLYGIGRFTGEFFREPDQGQPGAAGVPAILGFMTKGQAFTLPLIVGGLVLAVWALRRPSRPELYAAATPPQAAR